MIRWSRVVAGRFTASLVLAGGVLTPLISAIETGFQGYLTTEQPAPRGTISRGTYRVFEDRDRQEGRTIGLDVVVLHATAEDKKPDPVVFMAGGPGQNAAAVADAMVTWWPRRERDLVFVSQRGTGSDHRLDVEFGGEFAEVESAAGEFAPGDDDLQRYLDPIFDEATFRRSVETLSKRADLRLYSTPIASDDLDEVLTALGYEQVNLVGGSYGTRASLVFMRRHERRVRSAILRGVAPLAFKNPLYHAASAQEGLEAIFDEVSADRTLRRVYPDLRGTFQQILRRLDRAPVAVEVRHPVSGAPTTVRLSRTAFCEALRVLMYYTRANRSIPLLLRRASEGDFVEFAQMGIASARGIRRSLAFGMLMSVTAAEDLARITEDEVVSATRGTFLGADRVRAQMAVGLTWPKSRLPDGFGDPVSVAVPTLVISGSHDPVTPPRWGEEAHRHLKNSVHIIVPSAHDVSATGLDRVQRQFLDQGSVEGLDLSVLAGATIPRILLDL